MRAIDLDSIIDCWICGGDGQVEAGPCELCKGEGGANHYAENHPAISRVKVGQVIMGAEYTAKGIGFLVHYQPINDKNEGGFNELYGSDTVDTTKANLIDAGVDPDVAARLHNDLAVDSAMDVHGRTIDTSDSPGAWSNDPTPDQVEWWLAERDAAEPEGYPDYQRFVKIRNRLGI